MEQVLLALGKTPCFYRHSWHGNQAYPQMLTYLTAKGLTDAQIQRISGHESKKSPEVYQHLSLESVDRAYQEAVQSVEI
jgi:integrase